jgi:hypothetical protein
MPAHRWRSTGAAMTETEAKTPQTTEVKSWFKNGARGQYLCLPINAVLDRNLKFESLKVLMAIAKHADPDGKCFPSRGLLAEQTGMHPVNVSKATRRLVELGWLTKQRRNGRSSVYYLKTPDSLTTEPDFQDLDAFLRAHGIDAV